MMAPVQMRVHSRLSDGKCRWPIGEQTGLRKGEGA